MKIKLARGALTLEPKRTDSIHEKRDVFFMNLKSNNNSDIIKDFLNLTHASKEIKSKNYHKEPFLSYDQTLAHLWKIEHSDDDLYYNEDRDKGSGSGDHKEK